MPSSSAAGPARRPASESDATQRPRNHHHQRLRLQPEDQHWIKYKRFSMASEREDSVQEQRKTPKKETSNNGSSMSGRQLFVSTQVPMKRRRPNRSEELWPARRCEASANKHLVQDVSVKDPPGRDEFPINGIVIFMLSFITHCSCIVRSMAAGE